MGVNNIVDQLDVAAGNGNATLAAARRWCAVTSTDYVPALLERGRACAKVEGLVVAFQPADAEALPFADASPSYKKDCTGAGRVRIMADGGPPMSKDSHNQFCPVAKACEVLEPRWTMLILCEMWSGSSRFNEIRRGVPGMSPTLMSKRLKDMEGRGLVKRSENPRTGEITYITTSIANELEPIVHAVGKWAHRNIDADVTLKKLDARLLMWNMRRKIDGSALPPAKRSVIQFIYPELPEDEGNFWLIAKPGTPVDLCSTDPRHEVDLFVTAELKATTSAWIGLSGLGKLHRPMDGPQFLRDRWR